MDFPGSIKLRRVRNHKRPTTHKLTGGRLPVVTEGSRGRVTANKIKGLTVAPRVRKPKKKRVVAPPPSFAPLPGQSRPRVTGAVKPVAGAPSLAPRRNRARAVARDAQRKVAGSWGRPYMQRGVVTEGVGVATKGTVLFPGVVTTSGCDGVVAYDAVTGRFTFAGGRRYMVRVALCTEDETEFNMCWSSFVMAEGDGGANFFSPARPIMLSEGRTDPGEGATGEATWTLDVPREVVLRLVKAGGSGPVTTLGEGSAITITEAAR